MYYYGSLVELVDGYCDVVELEVWLSLCFVVMVLFVNCIVDVCYCFDGVDYDL